MVGKAALLLILLGFSNAVGAQSENCKSVRVSKPAKASTVMVSPEQHEILAFQGTERSDYTNVGTIKLKFKTLNLANLERSVSFHEKHSNDDSNVDDGKDGRRIRDDNDPPPSDGSATPIDLDSLALATNGGQCERVKIRILLDSSKYEFRNITSTSPIAAADTDSIAFLRQVDEPVPAGGSGNDGKTVLRFWVLNPKNGIIDNVHFNIGLTIKESRRVNGETRNYVLPVIIDPAIRNRG